MSDKTPEIDWPDYTRFLYDRGDKFVHLEDAENFIKEFSAAIAQERAKRLDLTNYRKTFIGCCMDHNVLTGDQANNLWNMFISSISGGRCICGETSPTPRMCPVHK